MYNMKTKLKTVFKMEDAMKNCSRMLVLCMILMIFSCFAAAEGKSVVATSFPCYDFARQVAGEHCEVRLLIRPGTEVHSYEPSPSDILSIGEADLFVYIGGSGDVWAEEILSSFSGEGPATVRLMESVEGIEAEHHHDGYEHSHGELELDEHIWTSPKNAVRMVEMVAGAMMEAMPEYAADFRANADAYIEKINQIDVCLEQIVAGGKRNELVFADRFPFLYLAHDYHLSYSAAFTSCASDTEPSAQILVELIQKIVADRIPVVYTIEMSTGTIARTLAEETGVEILTLHSAQTVTQEEFESGESYVTLMEKNLDAIAKGLNE